jgi:hypothetical protein
MITTKEIKFSLIDLFSKDNWERKIEKSFKDYDLLSKDIGKMNYEQFKQFIINLCDLDKEMPEQYKSNIFIFASNLIDEAKLLTPDQYDELIYGIIKGYQIKVEEKEETSWFKKLFK